MSATAVMRTRPYENTQEVSVSRRRGAAEFDPAVSLTDAAGAVVRDALVAAGRLEPNLRRRAEAIIEKFQAALAPIARRGLPPLRLSESDDGVLLEWTFEDRRLGFTIEPEERKSGWYFVSLGKVERHYSTGSLADFDANAMVRRALL